MKIYKVGGYIRDKLLGLQPSDCDYVVVGSNELEMLKLGFKKVGRHFPVFLHPITHEEYALARTEKKSGNKHTSFIVSSNGVTLEEDLMRRDITINAIAEDEYGNIIDPYGGVNDIKLQIIRHISPAFMEDPLRVLRVARFRAKLCFNIAMETYQYLKKMVQLADIMDISRERIIEELYKALKTKHSSLFFITLKEINALEKTFPTLANLTPMEFNKIINEIDLLQEFIQKLLYLSSYYNQHNYKEIALDKQNITYIRLYNTINNVSLTDNTEQILQNLRQLNIWRSFDTFQNVINYHILINQNLEIDTHHINKLISLVNHILKCDISHITNNNTSTNYDIKTTINQYITSEINKFLQHKNNK